MEIEYVNEISVEDYNLLRTSVGWDPIKESRARTGLDNSAFIVAARCGERTVGMARVISDGGFVAFIADVVVHPEFQGQGIGRAMMERVVAYIDSLLEEDHLVYTVLTAAKGKEDFYKKFGFIARPTEEHGAGMFRELRYEDISQERII